MPRFFFLQQRDLAEEGEERTNMTGASPSAACQSELPARARPIGEPSCPLAVSCSGPVNRGRQQKELRTRPSDAISAQRIVMCCRSFRRTSISGLHFVSCGCLRRADLVFERSVRMCVSAKCFFPEYVFFNLFQTSRFMHDDFFICVLVKGEHSSSDHLCIVTHVRQPVDWEKGSRGFFFVGYNNCRSLKSETC